MAPFLWMGFNCLKATATSKRQFTRNNYLEEIRKNRKKLEFEGLQFYQKVVVSFIWLSTLMSSSG